MRMSENMRHLVAYLKCTLKHVIQKKIMNNLRIALNPHSPSPTHITGFYELIVLMQTDVKHTSVIIWLAD